VSKKLLSIVVPCYNSEDYLARCIDSLLPGGESVEIIIVNDGSTDATALQADEYARRYAGIVRVIHQKNKGHGGAVNAGIQAARGCYLKVVDSDDWVDATAYQRILKALERFVAEDEQVDLLISNYVYEKDGVERKTVMRYKGILPENRLFTWNDIGRFRKGKYLLMHSMIYRTSVLRASGLRLPEHTFYVDNLFAFLPLPYVDTMYYIDVDFYRYYIGREDQSVNEAVMIKRIDQQIRVNKLMLTSLNVLEVSPVKRQYYMLTYLEIITAVTSILLIRSRTAENLRKKKEFWQSIHEEDPALYRRLRYGIFGVILNLPGKLGRTISELLYQAAQRIYGFN
jgi:glycosyltransferase involved in cell wall biosynthesis